jgi:hypothetical protein
MRLQHQQRLRTVIWAAMDTLPLFKMVCSFVPASSKKTRLLWSLFLLPLLQFR